MLRLYAPVAVAILAIVGLTGWEAANSDRFTSSSVTAEEFGKRFANVPMTVGPWVGVEMEPEKATLEQAGAVNHVSRRYENTETGQSVDLWLIVGHARDICRHTPDICYPSQGISQIGARVKQEIETAHDPGHSAAFFTARFRNESQAGGHEERVFWAWNGNTEGQDRWEAPEPKAMFGWLPSKSSGPKNYYGNNTALYKMYFTAKILDRDEGVMQNTAAQFAKLMLPHIDRALFPERFPNEAPASAAAASTEAAPAVPSVEPAAIPEAAPAELPAVTAPSGEADSNGDTFTPNAGEFTPNAAAEPAAE